jgi:hypothetical protein
MFKVLPVVLEQSIQVVAGQVLLTHLVVKVMAVQVALV